MWYISWSHCILVPGCWKSRTCKSNRRHRILNTRQPSYGRLTRRRYVRFCVSPSHKIIPSIGDYDGDIVFCTWHQEIVRQFANADLSYSLEPVDFASNFNCEGGTVAEFLERSASQPAEVQIVKLQKALLADIREASLVGTYSGYHEIATYVMGYTNKETIALANK